LPDEPIKKILPYVIVIVGVLLVITLNLLIQLIKKPTELFGLFTSGSYKTTQETWETYGKFCQNHSTDIMTPEFLCAMAQTESGGNQFNTPRWRWRWTTDITRIYAPSSSAAGLMQYTDDTFIDAKQFCIHDNEVVLQGKFLEFDKCWFNFLYTRLSPSNSIEMTSARLHYYIEDILKDYGYSGTSLENKHKLGAVIHLCGVSKGEKFVKNHFRFDSISPCGSHNPMVYYGRIEIIKNNLKQNIIGKQN
jgi:hypothetical protein